MIVNLGSPWTRMQFKYIEYFIYFQQSQKGIVAEWSNAIDSNR